MGLVRRMLSREWSKLALEKSSSAESPDDKQRFVDCAETAEQFAAAVSSLIERGSLSGNRDMRVYTAQVEKSVYGVIGLSARGSSVLVEFLVTHPNHIWSELNSERIQGSGSALLKLAERIASHAGVHSIKIDRPTLSARGFYGKQGYYSSNDNAYMEKPVTHSQVA